MAAGLNRAIDEARGDILVRQDADDASAPGRFARQLAYLDAHPDVSALGTGFEQIDENGRRQGVFPGVTDLALLEDLLLVDNPFMHGSMMIRADVIKRFGAYAGVACEDFELWTRLAGHVRFANLEAPLYRWRWHGKAVTKSNAAGLADDAVAIRRPYLKGRLDAAFSPGRVASSVRGLVARRLGYDYFELGRLFFACEAFERAGCFFERAGSTHTWTPACLWNRLNWGKYRISRRELDVKLAICRLPDDARIAAKRRLDESGRFAYHNPILEAPEPDGRP